MKTRERVSRGWQMEKRSVCNTLEMLLIIYRNVKRDLDLIESYSLITSSRYNSSIFIHWSDKQQIIRENFQSIFYSHTKEKKKRKTCQTFLDELDRITEHIYISISLPSVETKLPYRTWLIEVERTRKMQARNEK